MKHEPCMRKDYNHGLTEKASVPRKHTVASAAIPTIHIFTMTGIETGKT